MATTVDKVHLILVGVQAPLLTGSCTTDQGHRGRDGQDPKEQGDELPFGSVEGQACQTEAGASYTTI